MSTEIPAFGFQDMQFPSSGKAIKLACIEFLWSSRNDARSFTGSISKLKQNKNKLKTNKQKKEKQPKQKIGQRLKKKKIQRRNIDGQQAYEKCSTLLIIRERQLKISMRYHLTPVRWPSSKNLQVANAREGVEKGEPSYNCWWDGKLMQPLWATVFLIKLWEVPHKTKRRITIWSSNPTPGHISRQNYNSKRWMHLQPYVHSSTIHNSPNMKTT